ncbi:MAG: tRNA (adenosine(37)-N6)-threonylcarbamoyltransferase complex dimerization subunit type 1 TsaB [Planctomycetes bacterium]|nr:tRNA (adenosine(37)-N6)-threonylcarbamoyltransferase complex dimerization subunit type 1 TsaB [Planctomycetota bacterium]
MNTFLLIETSLMLGEVAISIDGKIECRTFSERAEQTRMLIPFIDELLREKNLDFENIDAIFVNRGPGSHTGVRVGITTARMLAYNTNKTLLGVSALEILALKALQTLNLDEKFKILLPTVYCRQGELYCQKFNDKAVALCPPYIERSDILTKELAENRDIYAFGHSAIRELNIENPPFECDADFLLKRGKLILENNPDTEFIEESLNPLYLRPPLANPRKRNSV